MFDRKEFKKWLDDNYSNLANITRSTVVSDASFMMHHDIGMTIEELLEGSKTLQDYKDAVKTYLISTNKPVGQRPSGYASHLKYLLEYLGNDKHSIISSSHVNYKHKKTEQLKSANKEKNVILINNLFTGRYIAAFDNIGHEFINIYQCDNGSHYVYANPYGNIGKQWDHRIEFVVYVRALPKQGKLQIIGYAEIEKQILFQATHPNSRATTATKNLAKKLSVEQRRYIDEHNIQYGGAKLYDILKDNSSTINLVYFITFKASKVYKAIKEVLLPDHQGKALRTSESLKLYIEKGSEFHQVYVDLIKQFEQRDLWEEVNQKVELEPIRKQSLLSIIQKTYDENVISNLLAYFFSKHDFWKIFSENVLNIKGLSHPEFIHRETENRIDLFIKTSDHLIIIENKVKSSISGVDKEDKKLSQLNKYYVHAKRRAKELSIPFENVIFYILRPDYNNEDLSHFLYSDKYTIINYSRIYQAFHDKIFDDSVYDELMQVVSIHAQKFDNELFDRQKNMLIQQIHFIKEA